MHITVAGKQVDTGEALQTRVREGLGTIARKYFDHALEANVTFRRDGKGHAFVCDINLKAG
ncbi:MAG: 30S ribosomal protein S30, partial [Alphaproteobacteria bacterium]|nr:30S ribosomal protein S30 [Alphaproteobacteria bacterium]